MIQPKFIYLGVMDMKRIYKHIEEYTDHEIRDILYRQELEKLIYLPISVGLYHRNWKYAQNICITLAQHEDERVRANSIFGLAHIARTKGRLDKRLVKPIILKKIRYNEKHRGIILDAISDINMFLKWEIARKHNM